MTKMGIISRVIFYSGLLYWALAPEHKVDPRLKEIVDEVQDTITSVCSPNKPYYPRRTYIQIGKLKLPIIGICETAYNGDFKITISEDFYKNSNPTTLYSVVAHEMTHCELHLEHSNIPYSYMNPYIDPNLPKYLIHLELIINTFLACEKGDIK